MLRAAVPGARFTVCELTAPAAVLKEQVTAREPNAADVFAGALVHAALAACSVETGWGHIAAYHELCRGVVSSP